jgi:acetyltransferase-like isoleucine patch superfamily enzyme
MPYLSKDQLARMGFAELGRDVRISDRAVIHNPEQVEIGDHSRIDDFCVISGKVRLGRNVHIAVFGNLAGGTEGITFGDFAGAAYGVHVFSQSDDYTGEALFNPTVPTQYKLEKKAAVVVGKYGLVGTKSIVFPGVVMGEGSVLGAMSMLTRSTEDWTVFFGIPARKLKNRKRNLVEKAEAYLRAEKDASGG